LADEQAARQWLGRLLAYGWCRAFLAMGLPASMLRPIISAERLGVSLKPEATTKGLTGSCFEIRLEDVPAMGVFPSPASGEDC